MSKQEFETWELGNVFNLNYQGKGYATEAAMALVESLFVNNKARRIVAFCDPLNTAFWKLLERLNMRREGLLLKNVWFFKNKMSSKLSVLMLLNDDTQEHKLG